MNAAVARAGLTPVSVLLGAALAACASVDKRHRPFSEEWADQLQGERILERREAHIRGDDELVLLGDPDTTRAAIVPDEGGKPQLNIGRARGFSADLDYDGGPEGELKYKYQWDFSKPPQRGRQ